MRHTIPAARLQRGDTIAPEGKQEPRTVADVFTNTRGERVVTTTTGERYYYGVAEPVNVEE